MHRRLGVVVLIVASGLCAGLLWASQGVANVVHRPSGAHVRASESAMPDALGARPSFAARPTFAARRSDSWGDMPAGSRSNVSSSSPSGVALPSMSPVSLAQSYYSMSAPEFFSDPAAAQARSIAVGDISGDGRDDLVFLSLRHAPNPANNRMEIYAAYQRDDGRLDAAVKIAESGNNLAYQILVADLDGDGLGDVFTDTADGVMLLHSNGDGTFTSSTLAIGSPSEMLVTDVDRDGYLDVLIDSSNTSATVVHGDSSGRLQRTSTLPLPSSAVRTKGDFNGDGLDDLVLATIYNRPLQEFQIYPALVSGGYGAPVVLYRPMDANQTASLAVGDFNADGRQDLALEEALEYANLHMYFQDSQGNLVPGPDVPRARGSGDLIATDLNRDGRTDLAMAHAGWGYVGYYLQTANGFTPETVIEAYQYQGRKNYFTTGDLNHDGCGDLAIARWSQSPVLLYGQCAPVPIADCQLPPRKGTPPGAASMASPPVLQQSRDKAGSARKALTRGSVARFE